jgi:type II restriction/modification system DNA methylase subunit YeeA
MALQRVKDLEFRVINECEKLGLKALAPRAGPEILHGIEINRLAAEIARTTIWIGDIQWGLRHALYTRPEPVLRKLDQIECRDAVLEQRPDGSFGEAHWPAVDFIIGNPPFLGGKVMRQGRRSKSGESSGLGDEYVEALFTVYKGRVPAEADFVCYWFAKAWEAMQARRVSRAGLVATNSIRGGANRRVLDSIAGEGKIFEAWSDEPWIIEGAAVRVSLVCFGLTDTSKRLDGQDVDCIYSDLTGGNLDLTQAKELEENRDLIFQGVKFGGPFEISLQAATSMLGAPLNPNGKPNVDVLKIWINGIDLVRRPARKWCVDFPMGFSQGEAALFEKPFRVLQAAYLDENKRRAKQNRELLRAKEQRTSQRWWVHQRPRGELRLAMSTLKRYIATTEVAKHRVFYLFDKRILPSGSVYAIARDDDTTFGILHSRFHEAWSLRLGTSLEDRPRYTPTTTFETFLFPEGLTPNIPAANYAADPRAIRIAQAAKRLDDLRKAWLNPPDLVRTEPEVVPGYPDRILPKDADAAKKLKERTLTNLYNQRPQWLANAHEALDRAVAAAYGWPEDISTEEALEKLLALNLVRTSSAKG